MKNLIRDLWLVVVLIAGASALLLLSDLDRLKKDDASAINPLQNAVQNSDDLLRDNKVIDFAILKEKDQKPSVASLMQAERFLNLSARNSRAARIALVTLVDNHLLETAISGAEAALNESGLISGKDYTIKKYSAQGEMGQLPQIMDAVLLEKPDVIVTVTTPALIAASRKNKSIPLVFTVASDPYKLNIFKEKRPDYICGVHDNPPVDQLLKMASKFDSDLKKVGIIYDAAQINSLISVEKLRASGKEHHIQILEATASTVSDLGVAAQALIQRGAEAFILSADNLAYTGFPAILKAAKGANIPIYVTEPEYISKGASGGIGDDYYQWGKQSGKLVVMILAGVPPSLLPIEKTKSQKIIEPGK
ncbi:MAG: ABC transporter substrate-binding protein [Prolixibacteraceae bacterium]